MSDVPEPVSGERRRDEAVRPLRQVPRPRVSAQTRSVAAHRHAPRPAALTARGLLRLPVRLAVAAGLTAYILWKSHPPAVIAAARDADWRPIAFAILLVLVDRALMAYRWIVLLRLVNRGAPPPLRDLVRIFFVSTFVGTFLPASVGGDAVRAYS